MSQKQRKKDHSQLLEREQEELARFSKALLTLSGGAFGLSVLISTDVLGNSASLNPGESPDLTALVWAWIFWGISLVSVVSSYYTSSLSYRKAVDQLSNNDQSALTGKSFGGKWTPATDVLNFIGLVAFVVGVILFACFALLNLG